MIDKKIPVILDGDPGQDDAIAWIMAGSMEEIEILGFTTVAGNQTIDKLTYNALRLKTLIGSKAKVAKGRSVPMAADLVVASMFHGETGLDGPKLPEPDDEVSELPAVEFMAKCLRESEEKVAIIATGAQTNVASLLLAHPELKEKISVISIMGGGIRNGNWTPAAEFNIMVDPEAADIVFKSGVPIIMSGLDVTERALVYSYEWEKFRELNNPVALAVADILDFYSHNLESVGFRGAALNDPCAVLALVYPEMFKIQDYYVEVETKGEYCRGETVADLNNVLNKKPNASCVLDIDRELFVKKLYECCRYYGDREVSADE